MPDSPTKLLILGSMDEFVLLVKLAKQRGCRVLVADGYEHGPAREYSDESFVIPITDTQALATLCREQQVNALITAFSDVLFEAGCRTAYAAGLTAPIPPSSLDFLRDKECMKSMFSQLNIPFPRSCVCQADQIDAACKKVSFPCVMKPLDGYGSYGVRVIHTTEQARAAVAEVAAQSQRKAKVVLEEYDSGHEFNMITWVSDGHVFPVSIADREKTLRAEGELPHVSRIVYPSRFSELVLPCAIEYAQRIVDFVKIENGPLCMQFFWTPQTGIQMCEVTGRVFGYEHELLAYASGLSIEDLLLDTALDHQTLDERLRAHNALTMPRPSCGLYFHARDGHIADLSTARATLDNPLVQESLLYYSEGDCIRNARGGKPYAARAFLSASSYEQLDAQSAQMFAQFSIQSYNHEELSIRNYLPDTVTEKQESLLASKGR